MKSWLPTVLIRPGDIISGPVRLQARGAPTYGLFNNLLGWGFARRAGLCIAVLAASSEYTTATWAFVLVGDQLGWFKVDKLWRVDE